jgi:ADP-ribose pyrophosphatase YjhB (NUDIX family)
MSVETYLCQNKCCKIFIKDYNNTKKSFYKNFKKSGAFIYDPKQNRVLLVQSRGQLFGPPKGSLNLDEKYKDAAIREVKEETGLDIKLDESKSYFIKYSKFYYLEMDTCKINVQTTIENNDANGITWIKLECLENEIKNGAIILNHYARKLFIILFKKYFTKPTWIKVTK